MNTFSHLLLSASAISASLYGESVGASSPIVVDNAGRAIGYLLGGASYCGGGSDYAVISRTGYFACVNPSGKFGTQVYPPGTGGVIGPTHYQSLDCSGQAYLIASSQGGWVVNTYAGLEMAPSGLPSSSLTVNTRLDTPSTCTSLSGGALISAQAVFINDPTTTGLFAGPYAAPLSVKILPDTALYDEIFFDGLEMTL